VEFKHPETHAHSEKSNHEGISAGWLTRKNLTDEEHISSMILPVSYPPFDPSPPTTLRGGFWQHRKRCGTQSNYGPLLQTSNQGLNPSTHSWGLEEHQHFDNLPKQKLLSHVQNSPRLLVEEEGQLNLTLRIRPAIMCTTQIAGNACIY
jgi:hypothetical protein